MFLSTRLLNIGRQIGINQLTNSFKSVSLNTTSSFCSQVQKFQPKELNTIEDESEAKDLIKNVNKQVAENNEGRLFAVVHLCGKQFKVTAGDIILVEGYWPPDTGDSIKLEKVSFLGEFFIFFILKFCLKVLLVGGSDFSLIGRPLLDQKLINVQATIIEKTLTHTKTNFRKKRRKQYKRINFYRAQNTMIRINSIEVTGQIDEPDNSSSSDVEKIF